MNENLNHSDLFHFFREAMRKMWAEYPGMRFLVWGSTLSLGGYFYGPPEWHNNDNDRNIWR